MKYYRVAVDVCSTHMFRKPKPGWIGTSQTNGVYRSLRKAINAARADRSKLKALKRGGLLKDFTCYVRVMPFEWDTPLKEGRVRR